MRACCAHGRELQGRARQRHRAHSRAHHLLPEPLGWPWSASAMQEQQLWSVMDGGEKPLMAFGILHYPKPCVVHLLHVPLGTRAFAEGKPRGSRLWVTVSPPGLHPWKGARGLYRSSQLTPRARARLPHSPVEQILGFPYWKNTRCVAGSPSRIAFLPG